MRKVSHLSSKEIYDAGYATPLYNISEKRTYWRYRDEEFVIPANSVTLVDVPWIAFRVAKIDDVRKAAEG